MFDKTREILKATSKDEPKAPSAAPLPKFRVILKGPRSLGALTFETDGTDYKAVKRRVQEILAAHRFEMEEVK